MNYADIFTFPHWTLIALSILQTTVIFCLIIGGLKLVGRRVFAQRDPQDLVIIFLVAETCDLGLTHEGAGFWGSIASVLTLLLLGHVVERFEILRHMLSRKPVVLFENGRLYVEQMRKYFIDLEDLDEVARENGSNSYREFGAIFLEGDGRISVVRLHRQPTDI